MTSHEKFRLLTRGDLDGLVCAVLMKYLQIVDEIVLIEHPSMMQGEGIEVSDRDITTNLPYKPGVHLAIDHHVSELIRNDENPRHIIDSDAPSAARVVYEYYGGKNRFPEFFDEMMIQVDKADSGKFERDEILKPRGWALLNFLVDQRTNLEEWGSYRLSEKEFKLAIIDHCLNKPIQDIMMIDDVKHRADVYFASEYQYRDQILKTATVYDNIIVQDCRAQPFRYPGNRFIVYALFPACNMSILIRKDRDGNKITFSVGKSIINNTSDTNIGALMLTYGGGGHRAAGACHVNSDQADRVLKELLTSLMESN